MKRSSERFLTTHTGSQPSYATYIKDRLAGFGGTGNSFVYQDLVDFPALALRVFGDLGRSRRRTPACNGAIAVSDAAAAKTDTENLAAALAQMEVADAFLTAASPGPRCGFHRGGKSAPRA